MADGAVAPWQLLFHAPGNPQLPALPGPGDPTEGLEDEWGTIAGGRFGSEPINILEVHGAAPGIALGYFGTYLNQVGGAPALIDFGNITAVKTRTVTIHNTFRDPITVSAVDVSQVSGVTLTDPGLPVIVPSFSSIVFTFEAGIVGDQAFDGLVTFTTTENPVIVRMIGRRVIVMDFIPRSGFDEQLRFKSDVMISKDGTEQAMSLAAAPRSMVKYTVHQLDDEERTALYNKFYGSQHLLMGVQAWWQFTPLTVEASAVDVVLQVEDTTAMELVATSELSLVLPDRSTIEAEVLSLTPTSITLFEATGIVLPVGTSVMPLRTGFNRNALELKTFPVNVEEVVLDFVLIDYINIGAVDPDYFATHPVDSLPIIDTPLRVSGRSRRGKIVSDIDILDSETGILSSTRSEPIARYSQDVIADINTRIDQKAWREFLHFLRGSWGKFYIATGTNDLPLSVDFSLGGNEFTTNNLGTASFINNTAPRRDVRVEIAGVFYYRRLNSVVDNVTFEQFTMDSVIPGAGTVPAADVKVSWLTLARVVGDVATFTYMHTTEGELKFEIRGVIE